jgi:hypothetical protein
VPGHSTFSILSWTRRRLAACLLALLALAAPGAARAEANAEADIIVTGIRPPPEIVPERSVDSDDVEAYGAGTVGEVIAEVTAEDGESRDDPAFLINGVRVAGLGSAADLPAEAIVRIDVLPAGSGVKVGASPRQRVYNIQLRRTLDLGTGRAAARLPTRGGAVSWHGDVSYTHIQGERRVTVAAKARDDFMLLESERDVIQLPGAPPGAGRFRSLTPAGDRVEFSLAAADRLAPWLSASLNSRLTTGHSHSLLGRLATAGLAPEPLDQRGATLSAVTDFTLNGDVGKWQVGLFANHAYRRTRTLTDRAIAGARVPGVAPTRSTATSVGASLNAFGPVVELPAGPMTLNLAVGVSRDSIRGMRDVSGLGVRHATRLTFTTVSAALELPIAARGKGPLGKVGDLSASAELSRQHASDFGGFRDHSLSLLWRPSLWLTVTGSFSRSDSAPPIASLDEPILETPGVPYYDPLRGETVAVTRITGGTPSLARQSDETKRLGANLKPFRSLALRFTADYLAIRNRNLVSDLPAASPAILAAFPGRFQRDAGGRLVSVDARPVSFASRSEQQLRTGILLNLPLGRSGKGRGALADDGEDSGDGPARPARPGLRPRLQLSASHTWLLESGLIIAPGQRRIDLLSREAVGFGGLGRPRHRVDATLGYAERGVGARISMQSRGESLIEAGGGGTANMLRFTPLTTFSLKAWVQGERIAPGSRLLKGSRFTLSVQNATDVRERVRDRFGATPLSYQPAYRDPVGRLVEIEFRKKF